MKKRNVPDIYKMISEESSKKSKSTITSPIVEVKEPEPKRQLVYNRELHDAMVMAEAFNENRIGKEGYVLKEGWDIYHIINSLVVLWRSLKNEITLGKVEIATKNHDQLGK